MRVISRMNVGGPAVQVSGLMRRLPADVFEQRLFVGQCDEDEVDFLETQAPDVEFTHVPGLGRAPRALDDGRALRSLERAIRRFRPHVVHTHTAKAGALGRVASILARTGAARVHTFHGHLLHGYFGPAATRALIATERALAASSDRLVAVGPQVRDDLLAAGIGTRDQFAVIPPGLELGVLPDWLAAREMLGLRPGGPVVAFIGRLAPIKRVDRFIEVVRRVVHDVPNVQFVAAGGGHDELLLRRAVAAEQLPVRVLGWRSDVETVLAASNLILLTSDNEGTPVSLIQAALAGVPAVAADVGSVRDVVVDGETGWLALPNGPDLASRTVHALRTTGELQRRGRLAQASAVERYGVGRLAQDHSRLYLEIARSRIG